MAEQVVCDNNTISVKNVISVENSAFPLSQDGLYVGASGTVWNANAEPWIASGQQPNVPTSQPELDQQEPDPGCTCTLDLEQPEPNCVGHPESERQEQLEQPESGSIGYPELDQQELEKQEPDSDCADISDTVDDSSHEPNVEDLHVYFDTRENDYGITYFRIYDTVRKVEISLKEEQARNILRNIDNCMIPSKNMDENGNPIMAQAFNKIFLTSDGTGGIRRIICDMPVKKLEDYRENVVSWLFEYGFSKLS